jgi:hypothetical protein
VLLSSGNSYTYSLDVPAHSRRTCATGHAAANEKRIQITFGPAGARHVNRPNASCTPRSTSLGRLLPELMPDCQEIVGRDVHNRARRRMNFPTRARLHTVREIGKERMIRWWCVDQAARLVATRSQAGVAPLLLQLSVGFAEWATWSCYIGLNRLSARSVGTKYNYFTDKGLRRPTARIRQAPQRQKNVAIMPINTWPHTPQYEHLDRNAIWHDYLLCRPRPRPRGD